MQETILGFICFGRLILSRRKLTNEVFSYTLQTNDNETTQLAEILQKFWSIEETNELEHALTPEHEMVEQLFDQTHYRNDNGRYVVQIPLKKDIFPIADSRYRITQISSAGTTITTRSGLTTEIHSIHERISAVGSHGCSNETTDSWTNGVYSTSCYYKKI